MEYFESNFFSDFAVVKVKYEDEFAVISSTERCGAVKRMRQIFPSLLISERENREDLIVKSNKLREQGNKLFQAGSKQYALAASRFYTKAIFVAPLDESLALAHANRAAALMEFGYIQQAYDDCECALELGYPEDLRVKIWMRQANCAQQLGDVELLSKHIEVLDNHKLDANFIKPFKKLKRELQRLIEIAYSRTIEQNDVSKASTKLHRAAYKIIDKNDQCMIATEFIPKKGLVFQEEFTSFVVCSQKFICHQCATTLLIPFPCYRCHGKVVYCSLKCRRTHQPIHSIECFGDQKDFFLWFGPEVRLAFRLTIEHFPTVAATLRYAQSAKQMWYELTAVGGLVRSTNSAYAQILAMKTLWDERTEDHIFKVSLNSHLLVEYLSVCTNFFDMNIFKNTRVGRDDWKLVVGSLILRHVFQVGQNGAYCTGIYRHNLYSIDFDLLCDKLWTKPGHVRCGFLNQFQFHKPHTFAIFPYRNQCRHSCEKSFDTKYSCRSISTFAAKSIKSNEEIFDCYVTDYRILDKQERRDMLRTRFHLTCKCSRCVDPEIERGYSEKFYRFRCEKIDCRKTFISSVPIIEITMSTADYRHAYTCSHCKRYQRKLYELELNISKLHHNVKNNKQRNRLYQTYEELDKHLLDLNFIKYNYGALILGLIFSKSSEFRMVDTDFAKLTNIAKFVLRVYCAMFGSRSVYYVTGMVYLWDIIALGKYKPSQSEMTEMLEAIEILSDDMQEVFMNYYNDFIADKCQAQEPV